MRGHSRPGRARASLVLPLLGSVALAGCATPQLAQPAAGVAVPADWQETRVAPASVVLATYGRMLDDPLLTEFVE
ncbi:MAG TPA: hypothetical protein VFS49_04870, partial [Croceibacterium sp.]|nr:hypothetical protein [Croceibacterium sp.]